MNRKFNLNLGAKYDYSFGFEFYPQTDLFSFGVDLGDKTNQRPITFKFQLTTILSIAFLFLFGFNLLTLILFLTSLYIGWGKFYVSLPFAPYESQGLGYPNEVKEYQIYWYNIEMGRFIPDSLVIQLGGNGHYFYNPFILRYHSKQLLMNDGTWLKGKEAESCDYYTHGDKYNDLKQYKVPYHYTTKKGEKQETVATVTVEKRELRRKILFNTSFGSKVIKYINVDFETGVGEGDKVKWGSRNFTIGCSYQMKDGETPIQTLRRMESERIL